MYRTLLLLPFLLFSCQQPASEKATTVSSTEKQAPESAPIPFKLISGNTGSDSTVFEAKGITAIIVNSSAGMQTIHLLQNGKRLINYMRTVDTTAMSIPAPELIITGTDTSVGFSIPAPSARKFFFKIKNNSATYTKTNDTVAEKAAQP